jgi:transcriptional regulator with XRE-family HTH domain
MEVNMGGKIRQLRKQKNISQDVLAQALGVRFQAVSKWETCVAMPDVAMIPAIASFFGVSTDELFDFNLIDQEKKVQELQRLLEEKK